MGWKRSAIGFLRGPLLFLLFLTSLALTGCGTTDPSDGAVSNSEAEQTSRAASPDLASSAEHANSQRPPNILLISLDTVRADHLGCYGYARPTTPNLDRLASQGVRFEQCRTQAPWTLPAHMSVFTSLLPGEHGVDNLNKVLPRRVLTLPEVLRQSGYQTAALVNNGQMRAHWGFDRGFDLWREFEVDTKEGRAAHITDEALAWLEQAPPDRPTFLFLHYYDAHDPYHADAKFTEKFGVKLTGPGCRELCFAHRSPDQPEPSPELLAQLQAAYDAGLAELDHELGRLFEAIDPETLVVVFSDHGEAFREHGWLLHGASLYEEEVRVPLLIHLPNSADAGTMVSDPVMLLDVAPTIVALANLPQPKQFQGLDLWPCMKGEKLPPRFLLAESKAVLEGRYTRSAVLENHKAIWSLLDGSLQLFRLPDEQTDRSAEEPQLAALFGQRLESWMNEESFWMLHAVGDSPAELTITLSSGSFGLFIPLGMNPETDSLEVSPMGNELRWRTGSAGAGRKKSLYLEPADNDAALRIHVSTSNEAASERVYVGPEKRKVDALPVELSKQLAAASPWDAGNFQSDQPGLYIIRYQGETSTVRSTPVAPLDEETIRQLRSLGYLK